MSNCPNCEHHKETARMWRQEANKEWVGLTDEECRHFNNRLSGSGVAEDIEFKLKERNGE